MRILFLSTWFPYPPDNGSKLRVYHLLRALARSHAVTLVSFAFDTAQPDEPGDLSALCADVQVVPLNPFAVNQAGALDTFLSLRPVAARPVPAMRERVGGLLRAQIARAHKFDVLIASTEMMATYALMAPRATPKLLEEHNSMTRWMWERYREQDSVVQRLRCWASWQKTRLHEARLFRRFDLCTMVSEQDRQACLRALPGYRGPVEVVPNGVDCQHNRPGLAQPLPRALVFNGALTYSANYDAMRFFLAEVSPLLQEQVPDVTLTITGSNQGVNLSGLRLDGRVRLSGYVDDVRPVVAGAWACVVPIRQGGGTRLKILEAMALGTPVVATAKGAEGLDVVPERDILIADDPVAFAGQVVRLLRDPALRERLAANGRRLVEQRYDWEQIGRHFVDLAEGIASRDASRGVQL